MNHLFRLTISLLFVSALLFTAAVGRCDEKNLDQQIAERTKQYQESLRQRAAELAPLIQAKIESQARRTVAKGLAKWKNGELHVRIALPQWAEAQLVARFVARHLPFSGSPSGLLVFGSGASGAAVTVTTGQHVLKSFSISAVDSAISLSSSVCSSRHNSDVLSYFILVIRTVVQRR